MSTVQSSNSASSPQAALLASLNAASTKSGEAKVDSQNRFLTLLVTQLKNQDPLNPMDNAQMTSQLAQISTVEGIDRLNTTLQTLLGNATDSQTLQAAALVGHGILVPGDGLTLQDGMAVGGVTLDAPADRVTVSIKDASGLVVKTIDMGGKEAGSYSFTWNGSAEGGTQAANGSYSVAVSATRGDAKVSADTLQLGVVSGVTRSAQGVSVEAGALGMFGMNDIKQIL